jgi:hypothetical protein
MPREKSSEKITRSRHWSCFLYPMSKITSEIDFRKVLDEEQIKWLLSPLHDKDVYEKDGKDEFNEWKAGEPKRAHYHLIFSFERDKSWGQVKKIIDKVGGTRLQKINDLRSSVRYLIHLGWPKKYQYLRDGIECHGGYDINKFFDEDDPLAEIRKIEDEIFNYCKENNIREYYKIFDYSRENNSKWRDVLRSSHSFFKNYFASWRGEAKEKEKKSLEIVPLFVNKKSGEILG